MHLVLLIVAIVLFVLDALAYWFPTPQPWGGRLQSLGLAFFAGSFVVGP
jgi:hypothetical protein